MARLLEEWIKGFQLAEAEPLHQGHFVRDQLCLGSGISWGGGYLSQIVF